MEILASVPGLLAEAANPESVRKAFIVIALVAVGCIIYAVIRKGKGK